METANLASFGRLGEEAAFLFTLENDALRARVTNYGGILVSLEVPDRSKHWDHIVLGFDNVAAYEANGGSFGALIGRTANRIAHGTFALNGETHLLSKDGTGNTLHGGKRGFGKQFWTPVSADQNHVHLTLRSPDGDQGFPGEVQVDAVYQLDGTDLRLTFDATTSAPTPLSLSSHPYFNLDSALGDDCLDHTIQIWADHYLPTDNLQIPTGELRLVEGTPFDFRELRPIGERIRTVDQQLQFGHGYDHYFVLMDSDSSHPRMAARVCAGQSGRVLELLTTQPGVQFYAGNNLDGSVAGREALYRQSAGFALEPHGFPNAPNQANFPSIILRPGQKYHQETIYRVTS